MLAGADYGIVLALTQLISPMRRRIYLRTRLELLDYFLLPYDALEFTFEFYFHISTCYLN